MSQAAVRSALENRLNAMAPSLATAWENVSFAPPAVTVPYQKSHVLFARPDNAEWGKGRFEQGYLQVTLMYPQNQGSINAAARAKAIGDWFPKALTLTHSGINTSINKPAEVGNGVPDGDRWSLVVRVPFHAWVA
jgi:hypothetical protein